MILTKIYRKEDNITEKFALLNLIKALQGFSAPAATPAESVTEEAPTPAPAVSEVRADGFNAMANVLAKHEAILNRVKNKDTRR